jgi:hypothetical protein
MMATRQWFVEKREVRQITNGFFNKRKVISKRGIVLWVSEPLA